ncbi:hypothetical protein IGJ91_002537 [Enterococcus sp. DIV0765f]
MELLVKETLELRKKGIYFFRITLVIRSLRKVITKEKSPIKRQS